MSFLSIGGVPNNRVNRDTQFEREQQPIQNVKTVANSGELVLIHASTITRRNATDRCITEVMFLWASPKSG